jgi:NAD(P)-dependent dehydrogenase (short-subunit alcohol dehydrogenase family)
MKTWFITGISRGLGFALAKAAIEEGDTVVGSVRGETPAIVGRGTLHVIRMDMTDGVAVAKAIDEAVARFGKLDVIVNNAGYGLLGALEQASDEEMSHLFEVDVYAPIRVIRAALPHLRRQKSGHIINVTSIAGRAPSAGTALYAAAKSALEGLSAALALELAPLGIKVTAIAPGAFRTDFLKETSIRVSKTAEAGYADSADKAVAAFSQMNGKQLGDPARAAQAILAVVKSDAPPVHLLLGSDALSRANARLDAMRADIARWETLTRGTDFPS